MATAQPQRIERRDDPRIHIYGYARDPQLLQTHGVFIAESRAVVQALLESKYETHSVLATETALVSLASHLAARPTFPVYVGEATLLRQIVGFALHRGCLAAGIRPAALSLGDILPADDRPTIFVGLDRVSNPDNVGSIYRAAAAFGVDGIIMGPGCADPLYRKSIRTSMAQVLRLPFAHSLNWSTDLETLRSHRFSLVALSPDGDMRLDALCHSRLQGGRVALLVGNEGEGLSPLCRSVADLSVRIPMACAVDSINTATAASIALHHLAGVWGRL